MKVPAFDPKELEKKPSFIFGRPVDLFSYPLNQHDAFANLAKREPWWQMYQASDTTVFTPHIIPDDIARGFVFEAELPSTPKKAALTCSALNGSGLSRSAAQWSVRAFPSLRTLRIGMTK